MKINNGNSNNENMKKCSRFEGCSDNVCPLDSEVHLRENLPGENSCPFTLKKRKKSQKGIKTLAPHNILEVIPKSNKNLLNKRNQKRWEKVNNK